MFEAHPDHIFHGKDFKSSKTQLILLSKLAYGLGLEIPSEIPISLSAPEFFASVCWVVAKAMISIGNKNKARGIKAKLLDEIVGKGRLRLHSF